MSLIYKVFTKHCLNCRDATLLVSQSRERKLSFGERLKLKILCVLCPFTDRYKKQVEAICSSVEDKPECCEEALPKKTLCESARERIKQAVRDRTGQ